MQLRSIRLNNVRRFTDEILGKVLRVAARLPPSSDGVNSSSGLPIRKPYPVEKRKEWQSAALFLVGRAFLLWTNRSHRLMQHAAKRS